MLPFCVLLIDRLFFNSGIFRANIVEIRQLLLTNMLCILKLNWSILRIVIVREILRLIPTTGALTLTHWRSNYALIQSRLFSL